MPKKINQSLLSLNKIKKQIIKKNKCSIKKYSAKGMETTDKKLRAKRNFFHGLKFFKKVIQK